MEAKLSVDEVVKLIKAVSDVLKPAERTVPIVTEQSAQELIKTFSPLDDMTEEDIKFYATPYFDELQTIKEENKKLSEESKL